MQLADLLLTTRALTPTQHANWRASFALPKQTACAARGDPMESLRRHFRLADHYRIAPAQAEGGVEFTFQFVWLRKGAVKRNHVSFKTVSAVRACLAHCCVFRTDRRLNFRAQAAGFYFAWYEAQGRVTGALSTCLLECGPATDARMRKVVLDFDVQRSDAPDGDVVHEQVLAFARCVCVGLCDIGYIKEPCGFVVATRHSSSKLSWHVTLSVLGPYSSLRLAVSQVPPRVVARCCRLQRLCFARNSAHQLPLRIVMS